MKVTLPLIYSQWDSRWASRLLGFNTDPKYNFYNFACLLCSFANAAKYYGIDEDPISLNDKFKANNGYAAGGGDYKYGTFGRIFANKGIKERIVATPSRLTDEQIGDIKSAIDKGFIVIVQLDYNPKTVLLDSHFSILDEYNPNDENDFTIADTLGGKRHSLKDYLGWFKPSVRNTIEKYIIIEGPVPQSSGDGVWVNSDMFKTLVSKSTNYDHTVIYVFEINDSPVSLVSWTRLQEIYTKLKTDFNAMANAMKNLQDDLYKASNEIGTYEIQIDNLDAKIEYERLLNKVQSEEIKNLDDQVTDLSNNLTATQPNLSSFSSVALITEVLNRLVPKQNG